MKTIKIGRAPGNDFIVNDSVVSSHHAVITVKDNGEILIEDLGSKNGTFVDGKRIKSQILSPSSTVLLANHSIDWKTIVRSVSTKVPKVSVSFPPETVDRKLIGRSPDANVRYSFDDVSERHCWLCRLKDGSVVLIDNNSTNGTYVNGQRIHSPYNLRKGDSVSISNTHPFNWETVFPIKRQVNFVALSAIAAAIVVLAALLALKPWKHLNRDWSDIYAEHKHDVVMIYLKSTYAVTAQGRPLSNYLDGFDKLDYCYIDNDGNAAPGISTSYGTGFFISPDGKLLTNRHVVGSIEEQEKNCENIRNAVASFLANEGYRKLAAAIEVNYVVLSLGVAQNDTFVDSENDLVPCTVLKRSNDEELDVAILQTNSKSIPGGSTYVDLSKAVPSEKLKLGYEICTIGFPKAFIIGATSEGLEANNQSGEITQVRGRYEYGHNIIIHQGASGSPVYDRKGRFVGIIVSGFLGVSQGYNQAIQPDPVLEFVEKSI